MGQGLTIPVRLPTEECEEEVNELRDIEAGVASRVDGQSAMPSLSWSPARQASWDD